MNHSDKKIRTVSSPRWSGQIREQLGDLAKVKESALAYGDKDFVGRVTIQGILAHEKELLEELHAAELLEAAENAKMAAQPDSGHPAAPTQAGV